MEKHQKTKLSQDQQATYQIIVPGTLDASLTDWAGEMTVAVRSDGDGLPVTALTGTLDQAALLGLLRRLYSLGLPIISVMFIRIERDY